MATTLPSDTTKTDFDAGTDDPKQARVEFATNADIQNELKAALGDFAQLNLKAASGLETVAQAGGTPDDARVNLDGNSIKRTTNGIAVDVPHKRKTADYLAVAADRGKLQEMDKATAIVLNLTAAATLGEGWFVYVHNSGAGTLTIDPDSTETIDDVTTIDLAQNQSAIIFCDGTSFWTVGRSLGGPVLDTEQATTSGTVIDFTSIPAGTKRIVIMIDGVSTNGVSSLLIQIGDSGGIEITGYVSSGVEIDATPDNFTGTVGIRLNSVSVAAETYSGAVTLTLQDAANFEWVATSIIARDDGALVFLSTTTKALSAELDRVRLTSVSADTFDAGAINILYD